MSASTLRAFRSDRAIRSDVAFLQANEADAEFVGLVNSFVDVHCGEHVASFRFVDGFANEAFVRRLRLLSSFFHGATERGLPGWRHLMGVDVEFFRLFRFRRC